ncbi:MAG TPA: hypothetical protein VK550_29985 [Polyangiaceae bacterium]|nr:hypothetical protein [Polyangiaceae bacterium]
MLRAFWPAGRTLEENYTFGVTYQSAGLASRVASVVNPAVVMMSIAPYDKGDAGGPRVELTDLAVSFTRGDQLVELMGIDIPNQRINFYLLAFGHPCHSSEGGCTATDVLGARIERDWSSWTLYQAEDIEDTGLSCLSCHQSEGPGKPRHFLMREFAFSWLHWGNVAETSRPIVCPGGGPRILLSPVPRPDATHVIPDLDGMFAHAHAGETHYAGIPVDAIINQRSGFRTSAGVQRMRAALMSRDGLPRSDNKEERFSIGEPYLFNTLGTITDQYCPNPTLTTWNNYRNSVLLERGLPVPYYQYDVIDTEAGAKARADYAGFLRDAKGSDALDILSPLMSEEVATGVGFFPSVDSDAPTIVRQMCVRCHTGTEDGSTRRARFDARNLDQLRPETMEAVMQRVQLPEGDPYLMPPRRSGHLPAWAIERIKAYFAGR